LAVLVAVAAPQVLVHNAAKTLQQLSPSISLMLLMASQRRCISLQMRNAVLVQVRVHDQEHLLKPAVLVVVAAALQTIKECSLFLSHVVCAVAQVPQLSFHVPHAVALESSDARVK
jgi:hypothetical protein